MPVNTSFEGRVLEPAGTFVVGRENVRDFARALGTSDPRHHDVEAARAAGYADLVAPPTYAAQISMNAEKVFFDDPGTGVDWGRVVHGEQKFVYDHPLVAGDEILTTVHVDRIREVGGNSLVTTRCVLTTVDGAPRCRSVSSIVVRGEQS
ncbi:FAS1-like dehydratase domain-containing protein [Agilicoccus flavus]|uniref:FAS1-like dehydratase domain-containing protein n=1 Tax=Agilicoccus flavus TaxID=2775968 RepID=UPI001CF6402C|nr:MaoC family dehydratase N-terminal domain-containing protein [Agilicoccus flavus]